MADSIAVLSITDRVTDSNGTPVSGAKLKFFVATTTTPLVVYADKDLATPLGEVVYTDSAGYPVTEEAGTTKTAIYVGVSSYKVIVTDAEDVTLIPLDNLPGALDTSGFAGGSGVAQSIPVVAKSGSYTVVAPDDNGTLFNVDCSGGNATMTLPSAITAGAGYYVGFRHNGTANAVIIATSSSQTISHSANTGALALPTKVAMPNRGEIIWLSSNGANWVQTGYAPALIDNTTGVFEIEGILSAPPSHAAGKRWLVGASPSGAWSTFAQHDVAESDGTGWSKRTPPSDCGWIAYVKDEDINYQFVGSVWQAMITKAATQAVMETGTSVVDVVVPGRQHFHRLHVKGVARYNNAGSLLSSAGNVSGISDDGTGRATLTLSPAFSSANYEAVAMAQPSTSQGRFANITGQTTSALEITTRDREDTAADVTAVCVHITGDL